MVKTFRYVIYDRVPDYLSLGWMVSNDLGPVHGCYSCLMEWKCHCPMVEPV